MADEEAIFQEAVEALRAGNKPKARELLTDLIKTDQNNTTYWIWLSTAMETQKERVYCLQTAFKLDPTNVTAKRGLILLGALPADESIQPFPVNRPRVWEEKLLLAHEKPKPKGWAAVRQSPVFRLAIVLILLGGLVGGGLYAFNLQSFRPQNILPTPTGGTLTFTPSPTALGGKPQATQAASTPSGPLGYLLDAAYTPTALYVSTERSPLTSDFLLQFDKAWKAQDWDGAIDALQNIIRVEPKSTFAYYYIGEAYRFKKDPVTAIDAYNQGLQQNNEFGPLYVGLARARLTVDPNANVLPLLDEAIRFDANFGEAYLERGRVKARDGDTQSALVDFKRADELLPNSPLVYSYLAQAFYKQGDLEKALQAAQKAQQLDVTMLENYLLLGQLNAALGNTDEAIKALQTYISARPEDVPASLLFGQLLFDMGEYEQTIAMMNRVLSFERTRREAYLYRFLSNIELGNGPAADEDIDTIIRLYKDDFTASLGILRTHYLNERYGSAEQYVGIAEDLAVEDEQKALVYYWAGQVFEKRKNPKRALEYWQLLLELPEAAMTADMRATAEERSNSLVTPTRTPKVTETKPASATKPVTATATPTGFTPTPDRTPTPTRTPSPTPTK